MYIVAMAKLDNKIETCKKNGENFEKKCRQGMKRNDSRNFQGINVPSFIANKLVTLPYGKERNQKQKATALH